LQSRESGPRHREHEQATKKPATPIQVHSITRLRGGFEKSYLTIRLQIALHRSQTGTHADGGNFHVVSFTRA